MIKYAYTKVTFSEVPDEISLCISISNCPNKCDECHSPELREDIGEELTFDVLKKLIESNEGITCVCIMSSLPASILNMYFKFIKHNFPYKVAWYTGNSIVSASSELLDYVDFIKIGPYIKHRGGLNDNRTNQRMYEIKNITHKFQK